MDPTEIPQRPPSLRQLLRDTTSHSVVNGVVAMLFASTGPVAIIFATAHAGGLSQTDTSSWIFSAFGVGGLLTIGFSLLYRQPMALMWTIPGTVLLSGSLQHLRFTEAIGAMLVSGVIIFLLGLTGWVKRLMASIPLPIVMGMVAGVFLPFALGVVRAFEQQWSMAAAMLAAFVVASGWPRLLLRIPPILTALLAGLAVLQWGNAEALPPLPEFQWAEPQFYTPEFSLAAIAELSIPLAVTVIGIQNSQGFAITRQAGFEPPQSVLTMACGLGTVVVGLMGSVPTCVTGPSNALLQASGEARTRYVGGMIFGLLAIVFSLCAPFMTALGEVLPVSYIQMLGGLAMWGVLQKTFISAFRTKFTLGALAAFVVSVSGIEIWQVGAAFWGLLFGFALSLLLEREDFRTLNS